MNKTVKLRDIASFSQGIQIPIKKQLSEKLEGAVRFIRIVDYTKLGNEPPRYIPNPGKNYVVEEDDIVMIRYGSKTAGMVSSGVSGAIANNMFQIKIKEKNIVDKNFLYWTLRQEGVYKSLNNSQSSSTMPAITFDMIGNLIINIPDLVNQKKITSILSAYNHLIENNTRRIQILEEMAQRIYKEWFVDFKYPGYENDQMIDSDLGMIPEGWEAGKLDMIARLVKNKYDDQLHSNFPLLDLSRIPRKSNSISDFGESNEITTARIIFKKSKILFGAIRPYFHKVVYCPNDGITNSSVFVIENRDGFSNMYLFSNLFSKSTVKWASQHSGGTKMPVIGWSVFKNMPVIIPRTEILIKFDQILNPMLQKISNFVHKNQNLKKTRSLLLPKLISGKRDVSDLDIDTSILND